MDDADTRSPLEKNTQSGFISLHVLTACCQSVLNTQFIAPDPKPEWFDDLNAKLDYAKTVAGTWINDIAPTVTSSIPLKVLNYAPIYKTANDDINAIANQFPNAKGADDPHVQKVQQIVKILIDEMDSILGDIDITSSKLRQWGIDVQRAHDDLSSGASSIQKAEASLAGDIAGMNSAIDNLHKMIDGENKAIAAAAIAIGVGIFALIVGIALAPVTGGASLIGSGVGVLAIIGGGVTWGVMQNKINDQFKQIADKQAHLADDKKQVVALKTLASSSNLAITSLGNASTALSDFRTSWATFKGEMEGVLAKLNSAEQSLSTFRQQFFTSAAAKEWASAEKFAQELHATKIQKEEKTLPMDSKAA